MNIKSNDSRLHRTQENRLTQKEVNKSEELFSLELRKARCYRSIMPESMLYIDFRECISVKTDFEF